MDETIKEPEQKITEKEVIDKFPNITSPKDKQAILNKLREFQLAKESLIEINKFIIDKYGGTFGIRSEAEVEASVLKNSVFEQCEYIIKNHPFVDGNKRTSVVLWYMFKMKFDIKKVPLSPTINGIMKLLAQV